MYNESLVKAPYPFGFIGDGVTRCMVLTLPVWKVRGFLPACMELSEQDATPEETHPVIFLFHGFVQCQFSFPTFLPPMQFNEQTIGIPFVRVRANDQFPAGSGPYYFMPKLYLDDAWVWMIGRTYWGFDKEMASVRVTCESYSVNNHSGTFLASLEWDGEGKSRSAVEGYSEFEPIREMLSQPLITLAPHLALTDFERTWNLGTVRPIKATLRVSRSYLPGLEDGTFMSEKATAVSAVVGAYELSAPWWLSFPYVPSRPVRMLAREPGVRIPQS